MFLRTLRSAFRATIAVLTTMHTPQRPTLLALVDTEPIVRHASFERLAATRSAVAHDSSSSRF